MSLAWWGVVLNGAAAVAILSSLLTAWAIEEQQRRARALKRRQLAHETRATVRRVQARYEHAARAAIRQASLRSAQQPGDRR